MVNDANIADRAEFGVIWRNQGRESSTLNLGSFCQGDFLQAGTV
jgi:hypothetical protein